MQTNRVKNVILHTYFIDNCFHFSTFAGNLMNDETRNHHISTASELCRADADTAIQAFGNLDRLILVTTFRCNTFTLLIESVLAF